MVKVAHFLFCVFYHKFKKLSLVAGQEQREEQAGWKGAAQATSPLLHTLSGWL